MLQLFFLRAPKVVFGTWLSRSRTTLWLARVSGKLDVILLQRHHGWRALLELDGDLAGSDDHRAIALVMETAFGVPPHQHWRGVLETTRDLTVVASSWNLMLERGFDLLWKLMIWKSCSSRCALLTYFGHLSNSRFDHVCLPTAVSGWADGCSSFEHGRDGIMFPLQSLWPSCHQEQLSLSTCASCEHG